MLALVMGLIASTQAPAAGPSTVQGLDHVPVVVADLERAQADFRRLGFSLKPGRAHANGIRNAHIKFPDGTEIELITATAATDPLAAEYRRLMAQGDGPAFLGLYAPDGDATAKQLQALGAAPEREDGMIGFAPSSPLHVVFFGQRQKSPTDRPEHFDHANGALRLEGVWLNGAKAPRNLLSRLGVSSRDTACGPPGRARTVAALPEGRVVFLDKPAPHPDRPIIAVSLEVKALGETRRMLAGAKVRALETAGCDGLWISPADAHGLWIEFRQSPR